MSVREIVIALDPDDVKIEIRNPHPLDVTNHAREGRIGKAYVPE